jgi:hypothetical protein
VRKPQLGSLATGFDWLSQTVLAVSQNGDTNGVDLFILLSGARLKASCAESQPGELVRCQLLTNIIKGEKRHGPKKSQGVMD